MTISSHRLIANVLFAALILALAPASLLAASDHFVTAAAPQEGEKPEADAEEAKAAAAPEAAAQDENALLVPENRLSEKDVKELEPLLTAILGDPQERRAFDAFAEKIEAFEKEKGWSPLGDPETWRVIFERHFYESIRKDRVSGTGRVQSNEVLVQIKGELFAYEYNYIVPRGYDHEKRWPVILCLHDEDSDGSTYLKKIWQASKADKDLCEGFILVAPDLREKTLEKKYREGRSVERRVEWFDANFLRSILLPLSEIRQRFHCDPTAIFIEGVGTGADAAIELAAMAPGRFAGVISRHGGLRDMKLLPGLEGAKILAVARAEGPFYEDKTPQKALMEAFVKARDEKVIDFELAEIEKIDRLTPKLRAGQKIDPIIDGNAAIADFVSRVRLDPYPTTLRIVNGPTGFKSHPLVRIFSHDISEDDYLDFRLRFDRSKNRIEVSGKAFFGFTVFLNDQILDLDKPIEVTVNGITLDNRTADRSTKQLVTDMTGKPTDYHQVLPGLIKIEVPDEPVKQEPKEGEEGGGEKPAGDGGDEKK